MIENEIHVGKMIQKKMEEEGRAVRWLAQKLSCNRSNIYKIYEKPNMDVKQLLHISRILHHDFFMDISTLILKDDNK